MIRTLHDISVGLASYRFLIRQLVSTSIRGSYKKSFIGMAWMFILPILAVLVWIVLQGAGIVNPGDTGEVPYPVYVLLSTSIWGFFLEAYRGLSQVMVQGGRLLVMKDFPSEVLVVARLAEHLIHFSIPLFINIVVLLAFGIRFEWTALLFLPSLIPLLMLGVAIGMVIAVFRVVAVDFATMVDEAMKLVMFLTPVVYTARLDGGWLARVVEWNPLTYLIGFSRDLLTRGTFFETERYLWCSLFSLLLFLGALGFFRLTSKRVLERLTIV
jgi:lipopolysaccharide transport system permease protein